jgi:hypothetical protein
VWWQLILINFVRTMLYNKSPSPPRQLLLLYSCARRTRPNSSAFWPLQCDRIILYISQLTSIYKRIMFIYIHLLYTVKLPCNKVSRFTGNKKKKSYYIEKSIKLNYINQILIWSWFTKTSDLTEKMHGFHLYYNIIF